MSFGSFVAAIYFAAFAIWFAAVAIVSGRGVIAGAVAVALAAALLTHGMLRRGGWARWLGVAAALVFGSLALRRLMLGDDGVGTTLAMLAAPIVALLLLIPFTAAAGAASTVTPPRRRWPAWVTSLALGTALLAGWQSPPSSSFAAAPVAGREALPASSRVVAIDWRDLGEAHGLARAAGKPLMVTVETSWCPYCRKMQTNTWSAPEVASRLDHVVAVRVDAEDGQDGSALAQRYGVRGFPTQLLLGHDGALIARADGFQTAGQFLGWLDGALPDAATGRTSAPGAR